jgi:hypothetical protein
MKTALWQLQKAIYSTLANDTDLMSRITGVYDEVLEDTPFPYVTISGEPTVSPFETKSSYGENITWTIHSWSNYNGKKESYEILNLILQALTKSPIPMEGGFFVFKTQVEQMRVITDIDGQTKHGIIKLRFYINN